MKKTIFSKFLVSFLLIIFLLSLGILSVSFRSIKTFHIDVLSRNLQNLGQSLSGQVNSFLQEKNLRQLDNFVKDLGKDINVRITVIDNEGNVLADSGEDPKLMENHKNRPEIKEATTNEAGKSIRYSTTTNEEMLYIAVPLQENGQIIGFIRTSVFLKDVNILLGQLRNNIINMVGIFLIISVLTAAILSKGLSKPIQELSNASRKLANGQFNTRVFPKSRDETKELADNFNYMAEKIQELFTGLSRQKEELDNIISSIQYGLLVIDKEGKIIMSNESFKTICQNREHAGKFYWEAIREPSIEQLIKKTRDKKESVRTELSLDNKIYLCSSSFMPNQEEIVIIFHDITEIKNIEKMKKDFVVNVSHELRTPLTAIKGFTESLETEIDKKNAHYIDILKRNTDRLINLVNDLLTLSQIEDNKTALRFEKLDLIQLIEDIGSIFEKKIKEKNLTFKLIPKEKQIFIKADSFQLEQVFINLIDNAIKYTEKGGISVKINQDEKNTTIQVEDTGIGISKENLPRIFERFYVVNKARSRNLGGTGLGLSIVKHIVLLHNGNIHAESDVDKGTKFTVTLPNDPS